jgi:hypothetical protein
MCKKMVIIGKVFLDLFSNPISENGIVHTERICYKCAEPPSPSSS